MIANNKYYFTITTGNTEFNIPVEMKWNFLGQEQSIDVFQEKEVGEVIGNPSDFEIVRFSHEKYSLNSITDITSVNYDFYFYNSQTDVTSSSSSDWINSYLFDSYVNSGFTIGQVYYFNKPFTKSFFKLDFYDSPNSSNQTNYITIIIPVQQGKTQTANLSPYLPQVNVKKPSYILDYVGDKEGFFIYWLKKRNFLDIQTFYMTAKFYNAETGYFTRMINTPQSSFPGSRFTFDIPTYFYYTMKLDYDKQTYQILNQAGQRVGTPTLPIRWYEYINP